MDDEDLEVIRVPVLTTTHVSRETTEMLTKQLDHDDPQRAGAAYKEGAWVFVGEPREEDPADLEVVFEWAREHQFDFVRFDCDGPIVEGLPIYKW